MSILPAAIALTMHQMRPVVNKRTKRKVTKAQRRAQRKMAHESRRRNRA